jgi:hypothetical protein
VARLALGEPRQFGVIHRSAGRREPHGTRHLSPRQLRAAFRAQARPKRPGPRARAGPQHRSPPPSGGALRAGDERGHGTRLGRSRRLDLPYSPGRASRGAGASPGGLIRWRAWNQIRRNCARPFHISRNTRHADADSQRTRQLPSSRNNIPPASCPRSFPRQRPIVPVLRDRRKARRNTVPRIALIVAGIDIAGRRPDIEGRFVPVLLDRHCLNGCVEVG